MADYGTPMPFETISSTSAHAALGRTVASSRSSSRPAPRSRRFRCGSRRAASRTPARSATRSSTARRWPHRRRPAPAPCWSARRSRPAPSTSRTDPPGAHIDRPFPRPGRFQAYDQGVGLINVGAAWDLLARTQDGRDLLLGPGQYRALGLPGDAGNGEGIYDREGVAIGRPITAPTRSRGRTARAGQRPTTCRWLGNDGTFTLADLDRAAEGLARQLRRRDQPATAGAHSAILRSTIRARRASSTRR